MIELVAIVAVTAVMVSLSMPVLQQTRGNSGKNQCRKNLKEIAMASYMYAEDHDGFLVPFTVFNPVFLNWGELLHPYLEGYTEPYNPFQEFEELYCPTRHAMGYHGSSSGYWTNYVINTNVHGLPPHWRYGYYMNPPNEIDEHMRLYRVSDFDQTSIIGTLFERELYDLDAYPHGPGPPIFSRSINLVPQHLDPDGENYFGYAHRGKTNVLFLDAHVASFKTQWLYPQVRLHDKIDFPELLPN
jgi:prepilin-type processing-associated H-X9-DG protein